MEAVVHTPVLVLNALDNALRIAIPIQVVDLTEKFEGYGKCSVTAVSLDAQFMYFIGLDFLPQISNTELTVLISRQDKAIKLKKIRGIVWFRFQNLFWLNGGRSSASTYC